MTTAAMVTLFVQGLTTMGCLAIGLFFLRFWLRTRDRLFLIFALAFWVLAVNRAALALLGLGEETQTYLYFVRLVAFLLILGAIIDKNRVEKRTPGG